MSYQAWGFNNIFAEFHPCRDARAEKPEYSRGAVYPFKNPAFSGMDAWT
jgi:hypothetical protein